MTRKQTVLEVKILQDPVEGWGHKAEDHVKYLQQTLEMAFPWYKPKVKLIRVDEVKG